MARNGSGTYTLPEAAFVFGTIIDEVAVNSNFSDIASEITNSVDKDGQTVWTGNMDAGNQTINNLLGLDVQSDNSTKMLSVDSTNDRVGIALGDLSPSDGVLHIQSASAGTVAATSSADELVLEGGTAMGITFLTTDAGVSALAFDSPSNSFVNRFQFSQATDAFTFAINSVTNLEITDDIVRVNPNKGALSGFRVSGDTVTNLFEVDGNTENVHINTGGDATSSLGNLLIGIGTSPTAALVGGIVLGSKDSSAGATDATLEMWLETAPIVIGTFTASHKFPIWINGTEYHIQLDAV